MTGEAGWRPGWFRERLSGLGEGRLGVGWDVARKGDLSVLWVNHSERPGAGLASGGGDVKRLRVLVLMRDVQFELQRAVVREAMEAGRSRGPAVGCGDATGIGADSNETLRTLYGDRGEPVTFAARSKSDPGSTLATTFDDRGPRTRRCRRWLGS